jgi:hypothetical protein
MENGVAHSSGSPGLRVTSFEGNHPRDATHSSRIIGVRPRRATCHVWPFT